GNLQMVGYTIKRVSFLGKYDVQTVEMVVPGDCDDPVIKNTFGRQTNIQNVRISPDENIAFSTFQFNTPVEYDIDCDTETKHRSFLSVWERCTLAGKGLIVTSVYIDWNSGTFYLGTTSRKI